MPINFNHQQCFDEMDKPFLKKKCVKKKSLCVNLITKNVFVNFSSTNCFCIDHDLAAFT